MQIGRKIYYEKTNGVILWDKGEMEGDVVETTLEKDVETMPILSLLDPTQLGIKQLEFGELTSNFINSRGYKINPITGDIQFV